MTPDEVGNLFTHADFTAQQHGIYSQHIWTKFIDKLTFKQLVDEAAGNFEEAQAVNFADLAKQAQLKAQFSKLQSECNNYFNILFFNGKEFTIRHINWHDLISGNYLKGSVIGIFGYTWYVLKE